MNKLLKEFLSYVLEASKKPQNTTPKKPKHNVGDVWQPINPKTKQKSSTWSAKRAEGKGGTQGGFPTRAAAQAWLSGKKKAPGEKPPTDEKPERIGSMGGVGRTAQRGTKGKADAERAVRQRGVGTSGTGRQKRQSPEQILATVDDTVRQEAQTVISGTLSDSPEGSVLSGDGGTKLRVLNGELKSVGQSRTATGPVHEVSVGLAMKLLEKYPDLSDDQLAALIDAEIRKTKLGASLNTGKDKNKSLFVCRAAVASAKAERTRVEIGIVTNGMNPETTTTEHFHGGTPQSKEQLTNQVRRLAGSGVKFYTSNGTEIDAEDAVKLIEASGSSTEGTFVTPADTFTLSYDPTTGKAVLGGSGNKTARNDQSLNTTVLAEITTYRNHLKRLTEAKNSDGTPVLKPDDMARVERELKKTDDEIQELSKKVRAAFEDPVNDLANKEELAEFMKFIDDPARASENTGKNLPEYFQKAIGRYSNLNPNPPKKPTATQEALYTRLRAVGWKDGQKITREVAAKAWVLSMQERMKAAADAPEGAEVDSITENEMKLIQRFASHRGRAVDVSEVQSQALGALQTRHSALNKINCNVEGESLPVGNVVLANFAIEALHMQEAFDAVGSEPDSAYSRFPCFFKPSMGDVIGYPDSFRAATGIPTEDRRQAFVELARDIDISSPQIAERGGKTVTFDIVRTTSRETGEKRSLCYRIMRPKGGAALNITAIPAQDLTDRLAETQPRRPELRRTVNKDT